MQPSVSTHPSSHCRHSGTFVAQDNGLGALFREYGEEYIRSYRPSNKQLKLIRSIRICRTPQMGGTAYKCKGCGNTKYVYYSCGNSQCPKCQGIKRMQWQEKLSRKLLKVPYQHMVFTMPHLLNGLAKNNPTQLYNILLRSAWNALKKCCLDDRNLGALPGAVMVLHTFGSDLKYHCHVHALVTFGGIDKNGEWKWPKRAHKLVPFRQIRRIYRKEFVTALEKIYPKLIYRVSFQDLRGELYKKSWCVHAERPIADTKIIEEYLSKYINRIGLSTQRFYYDKVSKSVSLKFKDYKNQKDSKEAPPLATKSMNPLVAIGQILMHCLPPYFQKCRYYGLHASATQKKYKKSLKQHVRKNNDTVRTLFQIIKAMLGIDIEKCTECGSEEIEKSQLRQDSQWIYQWIRLPETRGSPRLLEMSRKLNTSKLTRHTRMGKSMPSPQKLSSNGIN